MKTSYSVKGFKLDVSVKEKNPDSQEPIEIIKTVLSIEDSSQSFETSNEESTSIIECVLIPGMEKLFTVADNWTALTSKRIDADITIAEMSKQTE